MAISRKIEICAWEVHHCDLPNDIAGVLTKAEMEAYAVGAPYFIRLAHQSGEAKLVSLLETLDDDQPMRVYLEREDDNPWLVWFGFVFRFNCQQPRFRLPAIERQLPENIPERLRRIYSAFGGITDDTGTGSGILAPEMIMTLSGSGWDFIHGFELDPDESHLFYSFGNGDYVGWDGVGHGIMLDHERSTIEEGDLNEFLDMQFATMNEQMFDGPFMPNRHE
ncbi:MAG: hypothetical protein JW829_03305 [Pirellulales bacterium]|nr:hypothetical protein [Pirellulales bacterium]